MCGFSLKNSVLDPYVYRLLNAEGSHRQNEVDKFARYLQHRDGGRGTMIASS